MTGLLRKAGKGDKISRVQDKEFGEMPKLRDENFDQISRVQDFLFGGANSGLQEGSCQGVLPRASAASVLVPTLSHSHPPASAGDPPTLEALTKKNYNPAACGMKSTFTERQTK